MSPKRDRRSVQRLLHLVATRNQALGPQQKEVHGKILHEALRQVQQLVSHDFLIVLISDFHAFDDELMKSMIQLSRHNDLIAAQVMDPLEESLPQANLVLSDGTYQTVLEQQKRIRSSLKQEQMEKQQFLSTQLQRFGIPKLKFDTIDPVSSQLRRSVGGAVRIKKRYQ